MSNNYQDPLNPDGEQQLYESLSMSEEELDFLNYIRKNMRAIRNYEQKYNSETDVSKLTEKE